MILAQQLIASDPREKPSLQECCVGDYCLAGGDAFRLGKLEGEIEIPMLDFYPVDDKTVAVRTGVTMRFALRWTSEDSALYCWQRTA